jgi:hypothetical protein
VEEADEVVKYEDRDEVSALVANPESTYAVEAQEVLLLLAVRVGT